LFFFFPSAKINQEDYTAMAFKDLFKVSRKTFFNPTEWIGLESLKINTRFIKDSLRELFIPREPTLRETFEEAKIRLNLTEENIQNTARRYTYFTLFFVLIGICTFSFGMYLLLHKGLFGGFMLALSAASLFFVQAFRYNFWNFQIKNRKLGCTLKEWWQGKPDVDQDSPKQQES
jgi:intracellular multiplication protein IcmV